MDNEENTQSNGPAAPEAAEGESATWDESVDAAETQLLSKVNALVNGETPVDPEPAEPQAAAPEPPPSPEATTDPEPSAPEHEEPGTPPDVPAANPGMQKRIDELTYHRKAAEEENTTLKSQLTELQAQLDQAQQAPAPTSGRVSPAMLARNDAELQKHADAQLATKQWCLKHWDGYDPEDGSESVSPERVRELFNQVDQEIQFELPKARQALAARQAADPVVQNAYPEMKAANSQLNQVYHGLLSQVPEALQLPELKLFVGDSLAGSQLRAAIKDEPILPLVEQFAAWYAEQKGNPTNAKPAPRQAPATVPTRSTRSGRSPVASVPPKPKANPGNPDFSQVNTNDRESLVAAIAQSIT